MWMIAAVLAVLIRTGSTKTSYLRYIKDTPFCIRDYQYLTTISCKTGLQSAVRCLNTVDCILVDVQSGVLYKESVKQQNVDARRQTCSNGTFIVYTGDRYLKRNKGVRGMKVHKIMKKREQTVYLLFSGEKKFMLIDPNKIEIKNRNYYLRKRPTKIAFFTKNTVIIAYYRCFIRYNILNAHLNVVLPVGVTKDVIEGENEGIVYGYGESRNELCLWRIESPKKIKFRICSMPTHAKLVVFATQKRIYVVSTQMTVEVTFQGNVTTKHTWGFDLYKMAFERSSETLYFLGNDGMMQTNQAIPVVKKIGKDIDMSGWYNFVVHKNVAFYAKRCAPPNSYKYCLFYEDLHDPINGTVKRFDNLFTLN